MVEGYVTAVTLNVVDWIFRAIDPLLTGHVPTPVVVHDPVRPELHTPVTTAPA